MKYKIRYSVDANFTSVTPGMYISYGGNGRPIKIKNDIIFDVNNKRGSIWDNLTIQCNNRKEAKLIAAGIEAYRTWFLSKLERRNDMTTFNFTTREGYLAYRADWKATYKENSEKIRELKKKIKTTQRANNYAGDLMGRREDLRVIQRSALDELIQAKIEASEQYKSEISNNDEEAA